MHFNGFIAASVCVDKWHTGEVSKLPGKKIAGNVMYIIYTGFRNFKRKQWRFSGLRHNDQIPSRNVMWGFKPLFLF